jgi:hypothetical protein
VKILFDQGVPKPLWRRRNVLLLIAVIALVGFCFWFASVNKPIAVTLRDGTTLTVISTTYGKSFYFAPDANPIKRIWQELRMHLPYVKKPVSTFRALAGDLDTLIWFKHDPRQAPSWRPPWHVLTEDGGARPKDPPWTGMVWQNTVATTVGVVWKDCPTNLPTLTLAFYEHNTNYIRWEEYTDATFLGRVTVPNPAFRR